MFLFLVSLFSHADEPNAEIIVESKRYEEIYVEKPVVVTENHVKAYDYETVVFTLANALHSFWFKAGDVGAIYNSDSIKLRSKCNYKLSSLKCAMQDDMWVLRTVITSSDNQASINLLLFDERGIVIGQSSYTKKRKTHVIEREKTTTDRDRESLLGLYGQTNQRTIEEDLEPSILITPPTLTNHSIQQAIIMMYSSVKLEN